MENIEQRVKKIIAEQLGVNEAEIKNESSFVDDLGAVSLDTVELVMALDEEFETVERFGSSPIVDAPKPHDDDVLGLADFKHLEDAAVLAVEFAIVAECSRIVGEGLYPHLAAQPLRRADRRHQDRVLQLCHRRASRVNLLHVSRTTSG